MTNNSRKKVPWNNSSYDINYIIKYFATLAFNAEFKHCEEDELIIINNIQVRISLTPQRQNKIIIPGKANYDMKLLSSILDVFYGTDCVAKLRPFQVLCKLKNLI